MSDYRKMATFLPAAGDRGLATEFDCWHPHHLFTNEEQGGMMGWKGGTLDFIKAEAAATFVDLPKLLEHMIKYCWQKATPTAGAQRGPVQLASARQNHLNALKSSRSAIDIIKHATITRNAATAHKPQVSAFSSDEAFKNYPHLQGIATDWKTTEQLPRVSAYTFRGDKRAPGMIKAAGGFQPPITRTDQYYIDSVVYVRFNDYMKRKHSKEVPKFLFDQAYSESVKGPEQAKVLREFMVWRALVDNESFHLGRMLASEALKGYISTTRAVTVAKGFAGGQGWVYLTLVRGGYLVPDQGKTEWTKIFGEQEIALPCALSWNEIFGFRQMNPASKFQGPLYLRKGFQGKNPKAFTKAFDLLSGKAQK